MNFTSSEGLRNPPKRVKNGGFLRSVEGDGEAGGEIGGWRGRVNP